MEKFQTEAIARMAHRVHKQRQSCIQPSSAGIPADTKDILLNPPSVPLQIIDENAIELSLDDGLFIREFVNRSSTGHQFPIGLTNQNVEYVVPALRSYERRDQKNESRKKMKAAFPLKWYSNIHLYNVSRFSFVQDPVKIK